MARLAALVPRPRAHLTRYHGVFAPHSRWRAEVTPAGRGQPKATDLRTPAERRRAMTWAQWLKRVFVIETCEQCGRKGQGHRQHRGPGRDRDDPRAPGIAGAAGPGRVPDAGASQTEGLAGRYSGLADSPDGTF